MIFAVIVSLCCLVSSVHPFPPQYEMNPRRLRAAAYEASGGMGNVGGASAGAFSSAGTSIIPGPGGSGAFNAKAGIGNIDPSSNFIGGDGGGGGGYASSFGGAGAYSGPNGAFTTTGGFPHFGPPAFPGFPPLMAFDFKSFMDQYLSAVAAHQDAIRKQAMSFGMTNGGVGSIAYGQYSPQGGYGAANIYPSSGGGVNERFGDPISGGPVNSVSGNLPPPTGTFYGISTHSSSGQSNINGKTDSFKTSSVSVNDNGKVTTYTAHDP